MGKKGVYSSYTLSSIRNHFVGGRIVNLILRLTNRFPALVTTNARIIREDLGPLISARPEAIELVPNALESTAYQVLPEVGPLVRRELGVADNAFVWLAVGAQRPQKNYRGLLHVAAGLEPEAVLVIAGEALQQEELAKLAGDLGITDRVLLLGQRSDVPRLLAAADGFVQASLHEGTPNAVLEAMAASKPVVATAVGGVPDTIEDGLSGWLVPPGDLGALRDQMQKVMQTPVAHRKVVAQRAKTRVSDVHSVDQVASRWEELLYRVIALPSGRY